MAGLGLVWDIAKDALSAQRYAIDVTAHNIANVNTEGYSRQSPVHETKDPLTNAGLIFGRGVDTGQVARASDRFVENRLMQQKSSLYYAEEMENYVRVLEGIFNENSDTSISVMLSDYWNLWHDISNSPTGAPERSALFEHSLLLSEQFNSLDADLQQLAKDLTRAMRSAIDKLNAITGEIAILNNQIVGMESGSIANDLRDKRNVLLTELSQYIDTNAFEQENGTLTVVSARGCILVQGNDSYAIELGGVNGDRVLWQGSGGNTVDMTDHIDRGKMGGWLDMRDEVVAKYQLDLDAMAEAFIWSVNRQHSQGVGLETFSSVTADYTVTSSADAMGNLSSGLAFYDKIVDGSFTLWVYDAGGNVVNPGGTVISVDADLTPLFDANPLSVDIAAQIAAVHANISTSFTGDKLRIDAVGNYRFAFSDDSSNTLAALGINTFFNGNSAGSIDVNPAIGFEKNLIAAGMVNTDGTVSRGNNMNAMAITDLQYAGMDISQWTCDRINGNIEGNVTATVEEYYHAITGSVGNTSAGISREKDFNEVMVGKLVDIRDSISAVSLDEEMTHLMQFQHAYSAAAKLISTADEMMQTLLELK